MIFPGTLGNAAEHASEGHQHLQLGGPTALRVDLVKQQTQASQHLIQLPPNVPARMPRRHQAFRGQQTDELQPSLALVTSASQTPVDTAQ